MYLFFHNRIIPLFLSVTEYRNIVSFDIMILSKRNLIFSAVAGMMTLGSCSYNQMVKLAEEQDVQVNPSPLELHGDSVKFSLSAMLPLNMLKKNKLYSIKSKYVYGDQEQEFENIEFSATDFENQDVEQPTVTENYSFLYEEDMKQGTVQVQGVVSNLDKTKFKETPAMDLAQGIITTSRMVKDVAYASYASHGYNNKEELIPTYVDFFFEKGSDVLRSSQKRGENGKKLDAFIASKIVTRTVTITGSHCPLGTESKNSRLAEKRAQIIQDFYDQKMAQYDYKNLKDSIKFEKKVIFQDWKPLLAELDSTDVLTQEQKNEVKQIITTSTKSFEETEEQLSKLSYYKKMVDNLYPELRFSKTEIWSVKEKKTDAEISILAKGIANGSLSKDTLSPEELLYAATLTPLMDEKEAIYKAAVKNNDSWEANNNLGAIYLEKGMTAVSKNEASSLYKQALTQFELSLKKKSSAEALNNKAAVQLLTGKRDEAIQTYVLASKSEATDQSVTEGINSGLGIAYIKQGAYESAISSLSNAGKSADVLYNLGLAQLLSKDFVSAENSLENAVYTNKELAEGYYCLAIVGARTQNNDLVESLAEAVKLNADLREKALGDLEFAAVKESEVFTNAVK